MNKTPLSPRCLSAFWLFPVRRGAKANSCSRKKIKGGKAQKKSEKDVALALDPNFD
jgi:hypothetical protein